LATQTVTVLFTDLVGSTELSSRLGPEGTEALRQTHFGLLRSAITAAGGTEVKNLGDGLMVAFTSLSRSLACAVGMQQAIERHNQRGDQAALSVRIGIATGEATEEDGDFFGDPVVEAARLCGVADGGQILATDVVRLMAGRHATQEFVAVGDLDLKGIPEPVPTVEVVWEPADTAGGVRGQIPLPARLVGASAESLFAFFGRADELTRLDQAQKAADERRLRVTLISGEPGIGKTTLVAQAARAAHATGTNVLYGGCEEGIGVPYQPWISALSQLVENADETALRDFVAANGIAIARLVPGLAWRLSVPVPEAGSDADAERFLVLEGAARLLAELSSETPVMVVLDDLHWVDAASLQLLRHVVAAGIPMSAHIVGTFRESDLSRTHPLVGVLADLRRETGVERIDLVGLDDVDIIDLLGAAAGHQVAGDGVALAHALRRETAGNPFFVVEVIRHLTETGAFTEDGDGRWIVSGDLDDLGLPSSVREVVANRVARLGEESERALSAAAVIGRDFDLDLLAELLHETDEDRLLDVLEGAIGAGLVTEPEHQFGRYRFVHALIQHTLSEELSASRRQRIHLRIAEALEARSTGADQPVEELARHWMAATRPADAAKAVLYARRAGDAALAAHAPVDAVRWYTQALDLHTRQAPDDDRTRCELLVRLGAAQSQAALPEHRDTRREAGRIALRLADPNLLAQVALSRDPGVDTMAEVDPERLAVIQAALDAAGPDDSCIRAQLLMCLADELDPRDFEHRHEIASEALDVARRVGDDVTLLTVVTMGPQHMSLPDTLDRRLEQTQLALDIAERTGDVAVRPLLLFGYSTAVIETGDIDEFDACLAELERIVDRTGLPYHGFLLHMLRAWRHLLAGRTDAARADADRVRELGAKLGVATSSVTYGALHLQLTTQRGGLAEIIDLIAQTVARYPSIPSARWSLMTSYCDLERYGDAAPLFDLGHASGFTDAPRNYTWLQAISQYADCAVDLGRADAAPALYELLLPYAARFVYISCVDFGAAARPLGRLATLLGRYDDAEDHLRAALAMHERMQAPYWIARTQADLADLALARDADGDTRQAWDLIDTAQRTVDHYGYAGLQPRIDRLVAQTA